MFPFLIHIVHLPVLAVSVKWYWYYKGFIISQYELWGFYSLFLRSDSLAKFFSSRIYSGRLRRLLFIPAISYDANCSSVKRADVVGRTLDLSRRKYRKCCMCSSSSSSEPASSMFLKITPSYPSSIAAIVISCTPISQPSLTIPPLLQSISPVSLFLK